MSIDPTRAEWLEASKRTSEAIYAGASDAEITEASLGPCPPEPAPEPFDKDGHTLVWSSSNGIHVSRHALDPNEADAMAAALVEHAAYAREQEGRLAEDDHA
jgi:phosphosulfolactate phosphohydrolase-like enzyme